jgi:hypothetical protein
LKQAEHIGSIETSCPPEVQLKIKTIGLPGIFLKSALKTIENAPDYEK